MNLKLTLICVLLLVTGCGKPCVRIQQPREFHRIVCMSSTQAAMLDALGEAQRIVGISGLRYLTNREVVEHAAEIGYDQHVDYERLITLRPDIVLLYGIEGSHPAESKLRELGIHYMYTDEHKEHSPLGKARWIVEIGKLVGKQTKAEEIYAGIEMRYNALKSLTADVAMRPKVMVNVPYSGTWFLPEADNYFLQLLRDAGADLIWTPRPGTNVSTIDQEEAYRLAAAADMWVNTDNIDSFEELHRTLPKFAGLPVVQNRRVFNNTRRANAGGGNDFWESGTVQPDLILADLIRILHPELLPEGEFVYYRQLR